MTIGRCCCCGPQHHFLQWMSAILHICPYQLSIPLSNNCSCKSSFKQLNFFTTVKHPFCQYKLFKEAQSWGRLEDAKNTQCNCSQFSLLCWKWKHLKTHVSQVTFTFTMFPKSLSPCFLSHFHFHHVSYATFTFTLFLKSSSSAPLSSSSISAVGSARHKSNGGAFIQ